MVEDAKYTGIHKHIFWQKTKFSSNITKWKFVTPGNNNTTQWNLQCSAVECSKVSSSIRGHLPDPAGPGSGWRRPGQGSQGSGTRTEPQPGPDSGRWALHLSPSSTRPHCLQPVGGDQSQPEPEGQTEPAVSIEPQPEPRVDPETEIHSKSAGDPEPEVHSRPKAKGQLEPKPAAESGPDSTDHSDPEPAVHLEHAGDVEAAVYLEQAWPNYSPGAIWSPWRFSTSLLNLTMLY